MSEQGTCNCGAQCKKDDCKCCPWCCEKCKEGTNCAPCKTTRGKDKNCNIAKCKKCQEKKWWYCDCDCCKTGRKNIFFIVSGVFGGMLVFLLLFIWCDIFKELRTYLKDATKPVTRNFNNVLSFAKQ